MSRIDPLELKTLAEVQAATKLSRLEVLRAIADERLRVVWRGFDPLVPKVELDRYLAELERARGAAA